MLATKGLREEIHFDKKKVFSVKIKGNSSIKPYEKKL